MTRRPETIRIPLLLLFVVVLCLGVVALASAPVAATADCTSNVSENESIQTAINDAAPGTTVCVQEGNYSEHVVVNKSLTLRAEGDVVLAGTGQQTAITIGNETADLSGVTVSGFAVYDYEKTGVRVEGNTSAVRIEDVYVENASTGVAVAATADSSVKNVTLTNIYANETAVGIDLSAGAGATLDNVTVEQVAATNATTAGLNVSAAGGSVTNVSVSKALFNGSSGAGIAINSSGGTVDGVALTEVVVDDNDVGVTVTASNSGAIGTISADTVVVQSNDRDGILVDVADGATLSTLRIDESLLRDNGGAAIAVTTTTPADAVHVHDSFIGRNGMGVDNANGSANVDARYNYWGDSTGPGSASGSLADPVNGQLADGAGDYVSEGADGVANVRFSPAIGGKDETRKNIRDGSDLGVDQEINFTIEGTTISEPVDFTVAGENVSGPASDFVGLSVWERSPLPLRTDTSTAAKTVTIPETFVRVDGTDVSINRDELAVFQKGEPVTLDLSKLTEANTTRFANQDVQAVIVRTSSDVNVSGINSTSDLGQLFNVSGSATRGDVNISGDGVDVVAVKDLGQLDGLGETSFTFTPQQSGDYVTVLTTVDTGDGFERTDSGGLAYNVTNDSTTVIGIERVLVQETASDVTPESTDVTQGENVSFTAQSNLAADNVTHVLMAYDKAAFEEQTVIIEDINVSDTDSTGTFVSLTGSRDGSPFFIELVADDSGNLQQFANLTVDNRTVSVDENNMTVTVNGTVDAGSYSIQLVVDDSGTVKQFETTGAVEFDVAVDELSDGRRFRFSGNANGSPAFLELEVADDGTIRDVETSETSDVVQTSESLDSVNLSFEVVMNGSATETITIPVGENATLSADESTTYQFVHLAVNSSDPTVRSTDTGTLTVSGGPVPGSIDVVDVAINRTSIAPGASVEVSVVLENPGETSVTQSVAVTVNGTERVSTDVTLAGGASTTRSFTLTFADEGDYGVVVDGVSAGVVSVVAEGTDGQPGGGGGGGGGGDESADTEVIPVDGGVTVTVDGAGTGETIDVELGDSVSGSGVTFNRMRIYMRFANEGFRVELTRPQSAPLETAPELDTGEAIAYLNIDPIGASEDIDRAEFRFRVDQDQIPESAGPENVRLFHYEDGEWQVLETEHLGGNRFEAEVTGFSPFAVGVVEEAQADIGVTSADVSSTSVEVGESVDVVATVENDGSAEGTFTAELRIDGDVVSTQDVTVPAGETREVTFSYSFDEPGSYQVTVNGVDAGIVDVTAATTEPTETTTADTPGAPAPIDGDSTWLLAVFAILLLVLGLLGIYWRREGRFPWQQKP